jgi:hypothetical protein
MKNNMDSGSKSRKNDLIFRIRRLGFGFGRAIRTYVSTIRTYVFYNFNMQFGK